MPECDKVRKQAFTLRVFIDKNIIGLKWTTKSKFNKKPIKGLDLCKLPLIIKDIWSRGKILVFECRDKKEKIVYLISQLGMCGKWYSGNDQEITKHSDFWLKIGRPSSTHKNKWVTTDKLYFEDVRHFGNFNIYDDETVKDVWKKHGPCILLSALMDKKYLRGFIGKYQKTIYKEKFIELLSLKKLQNKQICSFMLEQKYVSGIGNYLRAEILYAAKIRPDRLISKLSEKEKEYLFATMMKIVLESYLNFNYLKCYNRIVDPYGNIVIREKFSDKRNMYWVPKIQK